LPHENAAAEAEKQRGYQKYFNLVNILKFFKIKNIVKEKITNIQIIPRVI